MAASRAVRDQGMLGDHSTVESLEAQGEGSQTVAGDRSNGEEGVRPGEGEIRLIDKFGLSHR